MPSVPGRAYIKTEVFDPGDGLIRTRGYIQEDTDPRLLVLIARDALRALRNRNLQSANTVLCESELDETLQADGLESGVHPQSGNWSGVRLSEWSE